MIRNTRTSGIRPAVVHPSAIHPSFAPLSLQPLAALRTLMLLCLVLFTATGTLLAQVAGATLSGKVEDRSGATIPGASIDIRNIATGQVRSVVSNQGGFFAAPNLTPGLYEVTTKAPGFSNLVQKQIELTVGAEITYNPALTVGGVSETVTVTDTPLTVEISSSTVGATVDGRTVRELPLNGRDWTSLAALEPGVVSVPNQATTGFSANKGNRGFGNQLSDGGHRPNENTYRVNGMVVNDYSNAAPGGATGVNLGVDSIDQFSVLTSSYTSEYGRTSGAVINAITKSGTNQVHGSGYFFDRDKIFDARNYFDIVRPPFRRIQFGGAVGFPIFKDRTFAFVDYEGIRQNQPVSRLIQVPNAAARAAAVPSIQPYLALYPVAPTGAADSNPGGIGFNTFGVSRPTIATENYIITRIDHRFSQHDSIDGTYFFDSGPSKQTDPLGNTVHQVFSRRELYSAEETHIFAANIVNTLRGGVSRIQGLINAPVSGNAVATNAALAIAPGAVAPPQIPVSGLTTAYGLGGFNRFNHNFLSIQAYDDGFYTRGASTFKFGAAFENIHYNVLELLSPNGRMSTYSLTDFLSNAPKQLNALAVGGSHEVAFRENLFAGYFQDEWHIAKRLTLNLGLRYEAVTRPTNANTIPGYTVNGYTVAAAGFQQITTLTNCTVSPTACGPVGTDSPIATNPTKFDFQPRLGLAWDPFGDGKTAVHAAFGMFDVLPLPYEFALNTAATAPFQIIGADKNATLGTGQIDQNVNFNPQAVRNRYVQQDPRRAAVYNFNANVQQDLGHNFTAIIGYVGSRTVHLSSAADDINLIPSQNIPGVGIVFPSTGGQRLDPNWGGGAGIRPVLFNGASTYHGLQTQLRENFNHGVQGQVSYTFSKCRDLSSAPVTGDTYLNSIAVPLLYSKSYRLGACDFDIRNVTTANLVWELPGMKTGNAFARAALNGWELGGILTAETGAPFTATVGGGGDPLGSGFNGDYSMDFADYTPGCNATGGKGINLINRKCFSLPTAPSTLAPASAANPFGCAQFPLLASYDGAPAPAGRQFCSNVVGNSGRNRFYGPRLTELDMSLFKNIKVPRISEAFNAQFRAEFFNILNHANFLAPGFLNDGGQNNSIFNTSPLNAKVNQNGAPLPTALNQTSTTARQIQLGLKVNF